MSHDPILSEDGARPTGSSRVRSVLSNVARTDMRRAKEEHKMPTSHPISTFISSGRYIQGRGALERLGEFVARIGDKPLVIAGDASWAAVGTRIEESLGKAGLTCERERFGGVPTTREVERLTKRALELGADVVLGVGGGAVIDTSKSVGFAASARWASVPTVASTDAPCSAQSVIYTEDGVFERLELLPHNPDLVLVDTQVAASAPAHFLIGGVGDALSTWLEARAAAATYAVTTAGGRPTMAGTALAKLSWEILWEHTLPALDAVRTQLVTPAVEKVIEATTLLSGLGFESGGLALAHAIHNGLTVAPQTHGLAHGQKVNIGSVTQLVLEGAPTQEIRDFVVFTTKVGLPNTLTEAGLAQDDVATLTAVAEAAIAEPLYLAMPFEVTVPDLVDALRSIEDFSRTVRRENGLPEPEFFRAH